MDENSDPFAHVLVIGAFIRILEASPPTDVVDEDGLELGSSRLHFPQEFTKGRPARKG
jgi:hypothetical protein